MSGKLSDERFEILSQDYEGEQATLSVRVQQLEQEIESYTDIMELTPEILREFIERIEIHERSVYHGKDATQQIDIYYNFIGMTP